MGFKETCGLCSSGRLICRSCSGSRTCNCTGCGGNGYRNGISTNSGRCYVCGGSGRASCASCAGSGQISCNSCNGQGFKYSNSTQPDSTSSSTGYYTRENNSGGGGAVFVFLIIGIFIIWGVIFGFDLAKEKYSIWNKNNEANQSPEQIVKRLYKRYKPHSDKDFHFWLADPNVRAEYLVEAKGFPSQASQYISPCRNKVNAKIYGANSGDARRKGILDCISKNFR